MKHFNIEAQDIYPFYRVTLPLADIFGAAEAIIVDTDYWQYAVIVECQSVMYFMKRTSAMILSRRRDLDLRVLNQVGLEAAST